MLHGKIRINDAYFTVHLKFICKNQEIVKNIVFTSFSPCFSSLLLASPDILKFATNTRKNHENLHIETTLVVSAFVYDQEWLVSASILWESFNLL